MSVPNASERLVERIQGVVLVAIVPAVAEAGLHGLQLAHVRIRESKVEGVKILAMYSGVFDLGMATIPLCVWKRTRTCADDLPYASPMAPIFGSPRRDGSLARPAASGEPRGE